MIALAAGISWLAAGCVNIPIDNAMAAERGNAATVVLCGLGEGCRKGMLFKQLNVGLGIGGTVTLKVPHKLNCDRDTCVRYQVFLPTGQHGIGGGIPKGESEVKLKLSDIVQSEVVTPEMDDEWIIKIKIWFKDQDDQERSLFGWAFIRINVVSQEYEFLGCDDPAKAWDVKLGKECSAQYTTGFRSALCGVCH